MTDIIKKAAKIEADKLHAGAKVVKKEVKATAGGKTPLEVGKAKIKAMIETVKKK